MPSYPYALTITNPGAETGDTTGWTNSSGTLQAIATGTGGHNARTGSYLFYAGTSTPAAAYTDIALDSSLNADIDAGLLMLRFTAWHSGSADTNDYGQLAVTYLNGSSVAIGGRREIHKVRSALNVFTQRRFLALIPPNTRTVRLWLLAERGTGTANDSYWDDLAAQVELAGSAYGIVGCDLWLKGSSVTEADGVAVSTWLDSSGCGNNATGTGTTRPVSRPNGTAGLNNQPTVEADGVDDLMLLGDALAYGGSPAFTIFCVGQHSATMGTGGNGTFIGKNTSSNRCFRLTVTDSLGAYLFLQTAINAGSACQRNANIIRCTDVPGIYRTRYNGATGEQSLWMNGVLDDGSLTGSVPATIGNAGPEGTIFADEARRFKGHIAEILVFGRALSDGECATIETALLNKYGLYALTLTATSPTVDGWQGNAVSGSDRFTFDTTSVRKYTDAWSLVTSNLSPFTGTPLDHLGDGAYYGGNLYVPTVTWPGSGPGTNESILIFSASDLSRVSVNDISAQANDCSCLAIDTLRSRIWIGTVNQAAQQKLWYYDLATIAYGGTLSLSEQVPNMQGLSYNPDEDSLWATSVDGRLVRIDPVTGVVRQTYYRTLPGTGFKEGEGLDFSMGTALFWTLSSDAGEKVYTYGVVLPVTGGSIGQLIIAAL